MHDVTAQVPRALLLNPLIVTACLLLLALPIERVPLLAQAQSIPLTSVLAALVLPFTLRRLEVSPLLKVVGLFVAFVLVHSVVALYVDVYILGAPEIRVVAWARQVIALGLGLSVFLVLRHALMRASDRFVVRAVIGGALLALVVALANVVWGVADSAFARDFVVGIRTTLGMPSWAGRASGLSLEPAHFAFYLAVIAVPIAIAAFDVTRRRLALLVFLALTAISFVFTVSVSGLTVLLGLVMAGVLFGPKRGGFLFSILCVIGLVVCLFLLVPHNYATMQIQRLVSGDFSVSFVDRLFSTVGPVMRSVSSYTVFGYGLGGTATHFSEVVPASAQAAIAGVRWATMPNLANMVGRIIAETGLAGLCLFVVIFIVGYREVRSVSEWLAASSTSSLLGVSRLALAAILVGATIGGQGSFALPYLWFWLAVIDSRYMLARMVP